MSKSQKILLSWSAVALAGAEYLRHVHLSDRAQMLTGAIEVILACATGIAFAIATIRKKV